MGIVTDDEQIPVPVSSSKFPRQMETSTPWFIMASNTRDTRESTRKLPICLQRYLSYRYIIIFANNNLNSHVESGLGTSTVTINSYSSPAYIIKVTVTYGTLQHIIVARYGNDNIYLLTNKGDSSVAASRFIVRLKPNVLPHDSSMSDFYDDASTTIEASDITQNSLGYTKSKHYQGSNYGRSVFMPKLSVIIQLIFTKYVAELSISIMLERPPAVWASGLFAQTTRKHLEVPSSVLLSEAARLLPKIYTKFFSTPWDTRMPNVGACKALTFYPSLVAALQTLRSLPETRIGHGLIHLASPGGLPTQHVEPLLVWE